MADDIQKSQADIVIWPKPEFPPLAFHTNEQGYLNQGVDQKIIQHMISQLPVDMRHRFAIANYKRIERMLISYEPIVMAGFLKNQHRLKKGIIYSEVPMTLILANVLVILKKDADKVAAFVSEGKVNLEALLLSDQLTVTVSSGRSYSESVDNILARHKNRLDTVNNSDMGVLFQLLNMGRVHGIIEFPMTIGYLAKISSTSMDQLLLLPIQETDEVFESYFAFPGNAWGKNMKQRFDKILTSPEVIKQITSYYWEWLPDEKTVSRHQIIVENYFEQHHDLKLEFNSHCLLDCGR